jgi:uridine kinase
VIKAQARRRIVSICGPSGSGKSFLVNKFTNYVSISTDDFYLGKSRMKTNEKGQYNFDSPDAVNLESCADAVRSLASLAPGNTVTIPNYDMKTSEPKGTKVLIVPDLKAIVVVEGIFSFHPPLLDMSDFKIFMEPSQEVNLARRFKRDFNERGRTASEILNQYPMVIEGYEQYIKPVKQFADIVIDFGIVI